MSALRRCFRHSRIVGWLLGALPGLCLPPFHSASAAPPDKSGSPASAQSNDDCKPKATPKDDEIVCNDTSTQELATGDGNDSVTVTAGATLETTERDATPQTVAIDGGNGDDTLVNLGTVSASATSAGNKLKSAVALGAGKRGDRNVEDSKAALATGIAGGAGDDTITNAGSLAASATALAGQVTVGGQSVGASTADAGATGVAGDDGVDTITNSGNIDVSSRAIVVAEGGTGVSASEDALAAEATSIGIDGGAGDDSIGNTGSLRATATAISGQAGSSSDGSQNGNSKESPDSSSAATASATGIVGGDGNDSLSNSGTIEVIATGSSETIALELGANGNAGANSSASVATTAVGIDAGAGDDSVRNGGAITATATSVAHGQSASVAPSGNEDGKKNTWDGDPVANAAAIGLRTGTGNDAVVNGGNVTAVATAESGSLAVAGGAADVKSAGAASSATAEATSVGAGAGDDDVRSSGALTAVATAVATGLETVIAGSKKAELQSADGTNAAATATGLTADGGDASKQSTTQLSLTPSELSLTRTESETAATGADIVANAGAITAVATAASGESSAAVSLQGAGAASVDAKATASAKAVDLGGGDDVLNNQGDGALTAVATAIAAGIESAVAVKTEEENPNSQQLDKITSFFDNDEGKTDGSVVAEAEATGVSGDGDAESKSSSTTLSLSTNGFFEQLTRSQTAASGADSIDNAGAITAVATALAGSQSTAVGIKEAAEADAKTDAKAGAVGIAAGGGDDTITNSGALTAVATAAANGRTISIGIETDAKLAADAGTSATAEATGISGDGGTRDAHFEQTLRIDTNGLAFGIVSDHASATGDDTITNGGAVTAVATATSGEQAAPVSISGSADGNVQSEATAKAVAVESGAGNDTITSSSALTAVATATATGIDTALAVAASESGGDGGNAPPTEEKKAAASAKTSVTSSATAVGLRTDDEHESSRTELSLGIDDAGLRSHYVSETGTRGGDDTIVNSGAITAVATALSASIGVGVTIEGDASTDTTTTATSTATALDSGDGNDDIANDGALTAVSTAAAGALSVSVSTKGDAEVSSDNGSTATATATGIDADGGTRSQRTEANLVVSGEGLHISADYADLAASGNDVITNRGAVTAVATAASVEGAGALSLEGTAKADAKVTSTATAIGIDAGGGDDTITSSGAVTAVATALAAPITAEVAAKGDASADKSSFENSSAAHATAIGITGDGDGANSSRSASLDIGFDTPSLSFEAERAQFGASGNDVIVNDSAITAVASAEMAAVDLAVGAKGYAVAQTTAEASAQSIGVDAGAGDDSLTNAGAIDAVSIAGAAAISVSVSTKSSAVAGDAIWDGGTTATATATGVSGDGALAFARDAVDLGVSAGGAHLRLASEEAAGEGGDTIDNSGLINAVAIAASGSGNAAVAKEGVAAAISQSTAIAGAVGVDAGGGDDAVTNDGAINATAAAAATTAAISVTKSGAAIAGNAVWDGGATADATAIGVDGDGEAASQHNESDIEFVRRITANEAGEVESRDFSLSLQRTEATTAARGNDTIINDGAVVATALAEAPAIAAGVASASGMAAAISTAAANADALGINGGGGSDTITNSGALASTAIANANAVNVAVTKSGGAIAADAVTDDGTTAAARAVGIDGDGEGLDATTTRSIVAGRAIEIAADGTETVTNSLKLEETESLVSAGDGDTITNSGAIAATAAALVPSLGVAVTKSGVSVAANSVTSLTRAVGIDAGVGDDAVSNTGAIVATSAAAGVAGSIALNKEGAAAAGNALWDAPVAAEAVAVGIDGDGEGSDFTSARTIEVDGQHLALSSSIDDVAAGGDDLIDNDGAIVATAFAETTVAAVAATAAGVAVAQTTSTAAAQSAAIDAGDGADRVRNDGAIVSTAAANANAVNLSFAKVGGAVAADAIFDGGTTAVADATGIALDGDGSSFSERRSAEVSADGVALNASESERSAGGDDVLINDGAVVSTAVAAAPSLGVAVTTAGAAAAVTTATSRARAAAVDAGGGDDSILNRGALVATALANADTVTVAVAQTGVAVAGNSVWDGGVTASAEAVGIDGDGSARDFTHESGIEVDADGVRAATLTRDTVASGADTITNEGAIVSSAAALTPSLNVAVAPTGVAAAVATATANARAAGIIGGAGDDEIRNRGEIVSSAAATALAANVSFTTSGGAAVTSDAIFSGGTTATAEAIGIDGDAEGLDFVEHAEAEVGAGGASLGAGRSITGATGADRIANEGVVTATSFAAAGSLGVAVTPVGLAAAVTAATANSRAAAIDGGSGNDEIRNRGALVATAVGNADTISVGVAPTGVAVAGNAIWDGGATANAEAVGIDGDGRGNDFVLETHTDLSDAGVSFGIDSSLTAAAGDDSITNEGTIVATAAAVAPSLGVAVAPAGVAVAVSRATADSRAAAIDAGSGDDTVRNRGELVATAASLAVAGNVSFAGAGGAIASDAVFDGGTTATAESVGIATDGTGTDIVTSAGMRADESGSAIAFSHSEGSAAGDDVVRNEGSIVSTAVAAAPSAAVSVTPAGLAAAITAATAKTRAVGIDSGGGDDDIGNRGDLTVTSVANADTVSVSVAPAGVAVAANALWNGGVTANAEAIGIDADGDGGGSSLETSLRQEGSTVSFDLTAEEFSASGNDIIRNEGDIDATAVAVTPSIGVAVAPAGVAVAATTATAEARAAAIDAGPGDDRVLNRGDLSAAATAVATAVNVSVTGGGVAVAGNDAWDGGVDARAESVGIETDGAASRKISLKMTSEGLEDFTSVEDYVSFSDETIEAAGNDRVVNEGDISATATAVSPSVTVGVSVGGVSGAISTATAETSARGIDSAGGADFIDNSGDIDARATSVATAVNVDVTVGGVAVAGDAIWDGGTTGIAEATAIDSGEDADFIGNSGELTANATAATQSLSVPVGIFGVAAGAATATTQADAVGIAAGDGDDTIDNSGPITVDADSNATAVAVAVNIFGVAGAGNDVWDGGTESHARAVGIDGGDGHNTVTSSEAITATATAVTPTVTVPFSFGGVSAAESTSTATAAAAGIETGSGDDLIDNHSNILADSRSTAVTVTSAITIFGAAAAADSVWDGGTTATSDATGLATGGGVDTVDNDADITATALSRSNSDQVAFTLIGAAGTAATSTSTATAAAADGGAGGDSITNDGTMLADADARATSVAVSVSVVGGAIAADAYWDGGTGATGTAKAIAGGDGNDELTNRNRVEATSSADSDSVGVAASLGFVTAVSASSTATADAVALDGGSGDDAIVNVGDAIAAATADAGAVGVSTLAIGAAFAGSFVDDVTTSDASATGLDGGDGDDLLLAGDSSLIDVDATARTKDTDVAVTATIGYADADAQAAAVANAAGLEGGAGGDRLIMAGRIEVDATADGLARSFSWDTLGVANSSTGSSAEAFARGAGGGDGDDVLINDALLGASATSTTLGRSIGINGTGFSSADVATTSAADAVGLAGDAGNDLVFSGNAITSAATANLTARELSLSALGGAVVGGDSTATSTAKGMSGGDGDDELLNDGTVSTTAQSTVDGKSTSLNLIGASVADGSLAATATAIGLAGGAGDDLLASSGDVAATGTSEVTARSLELSLIGAAIGRGSSTATTTVTGLDGGQGDDRLINEAAATAVASSTATANAKSIDLIGAAQSASSIEAHATATGMAGGTGDDEIVNLASVTASAEAHASITGTEFSLIGAAGSDNLSTAEASAIGIASGDGADTVINGDEVSATAATSIGSGGKSAVVFGASGGNATIASDLLAVGIAAGAADDTVVNEGSVEVTGAATLDSTSAAWSILGVSGAKAGMTAHSLGLGLDGGDGDDLLINAGSVNVGLDFGGTVIASSWTLAGGAGDRASYAVTQEAAGILGGDGDDRIENLGTIDAHTFSDLDVTGNAKAIFGNASGGAALVSDATTVGLDGGSGKDELLNTGDIDVLADARMTAGSISFAVLGQATAAASLRADAAAIGMRGGAGDDAILNSGALDIAASAAIGASGLGETKLGDSKVAAATTATAFARGIDAGSGDDGVVNNGSVLVTATLAPTADSDVTAGGFVIDGVTRSRVRSEADATAIDLGDGSNVLRNGGELNAGVGGAGTATSVSIGAALAAQANAFADARATFGQGLVRGVAAGNGTNDIDSGGAITAAITHRLNTVATADGSGLVEGNGNAFSQSIGSGIGAVGIDVGDGGSVITTSGDLSILTDQAVSARASSFANGIDPFTAPTSISDSEASVDGSYAIGIRAGHGDNAISNDGAFSVRVDASAGTNSRADYQTPAVAVDSFATADSSADGARAVGIEVGQGSNTIVNAGRFTVTAAPFASAEARAFGHGLDGDAEARATATARDALAAGILAGDGGNTIINEGELLISAAPRASAFALAEPGFAEIAGGIEDTVVCEWRPGGLLGKALSLFCRTVEKVTESVIDYGEEVELAERSVSGAMAYGIRTGAGDDLIVNMGLIDTSISADGLSRGIAISSGAGDDEVRLGSAAVVHGDIELADGDDTFSLWGSPFVDGDVDGGAGTDTLRLHGAGGFDAALEGFERAEKYLAGTYTLSNVGASALHSINVFDGTLAVPGLHTMNTGDELLAQVRGDGGHGRFDVGTAVLLPGSRLEVVTDDGLFVDGTRYDVLTANVIAGTFGTVGLPAPTPLLSFSMEQNPTAVEVVAAVEPVASLVAGDSGLAPGIAAYLDSLTTTADGDVAELIASLQHSAEADAVAEAVEALAPSDRSSIVQGSITSIRRSLDVVRERLSSIRAGASGTAYLAGDFPVDLGLGVGAAAALTGPWAGTLSHSGTRPLAGASGTGFASEDFTVGAGVDFTLGAHLIAGASVQVGLGNLRHERAYDVTEMDTVLASAYAAYSLDRGFYAQGVFSAGSADYTGVRYMHGDFVNRLAESDHGGSVRAFAFEAGRSAVRGRHHLEWFGGLDYVALAEEPFRELGAGDLGFATEAAATESLVSEAGLRSSYTFTLPWGTIKPQLNLAALHAFDLGGDVFRGRLVGAPGTSVDLKPGHVGGDGYRVGLGLEINGNRDRFFGLRWTQEHYGAYENTSMSAKFMLKF
jgi:hypothetical protein